MVLARKRVTNAPEGRGLGSGTILQSVQVAKPGNHATEELVSSVAAILRANEKPRLGEFDPFPAPLYATDATGKIVYFNPACVDFAGRTPTVGVDRWCVSWKLYRDDGSFLAHDQCPMAMAIREGRPVRGVEAFAERPDGTRTRFRPFPTPVIDDDGRLIGAINLLVVADGSQSRELAAKAAHCRLLAKWVSDRQAITALREMAEECERDAEALRLH